MSYFGLSRTRHIPQYGNSIWYVSASGSDSNNGQSPETPFLTIGHAVDVASAGDMISVTSGTYAEAVDLNKNGLNLCAESNASINGSVTVSANACIIEGIIVAAVAEVAFSITGNQCRLVGCKAAGVPTTAFDIDGYYCELIDCIAAGYSVAGFDLSNYGCHLTSCIAQGAATATRGFYLSTNTADSNTFNECISIGNTTAGFEVVSGASKSVFNECVSGGKDGKRTDNGSNNVWASFTPQENTELFSGRVYYVNGPVGDDTNSGLSPLESFATLGQALSVITTGDAINVSPGTYTETGLNLDTNAAEIWFEIGAVLDPPTGTALEISGSYCLLKGDVDIDTPAGEAGLLVSGNFCNINIIEGATILYGAYGVRVTGMGNSVKNAACGFQSTSGFSIEGSQTRLFDCHTVGFSTTIGFHITNEADTGVLKRCTSTGHQTAGYKIDAGSQDWTLINCSTGAGDGRWVDVDNANVWSNFEYSNIENKKITLDANNETKYYNLFKVTGAVKINHMCGEVTTALSSNITDLGVDLWSANATSNVSSFSLDVSAAPDGSLMCRNNTSGNALSYFEADQPRVGDLEYTDTLEFMLVAEPDTDNYMRFGYTTTDTPSSGAINFRVDWEPISDNGFLVHV